MSDTLTRLTPGMPIVYGGDRVTHVPADLAAAFRPGDRLVVVQTTGDLLHIPAADHARAAEAVAAAYDAFQLMGSVTEARIAAFYEAFAARLEDPETFEPIAAANRDDVKRAAGRGRSTTRLLLSDTMRSGMIDGLRGWPATPPVRGRVLETISHDGWQVEQIRAGLGVIGFVFEGRPNVFADATGVLWSGNTVVFRIGSDALGTARAIVHHALDPALESAGLPAGAVALVDSPSRAAGWAMFADSRLSLAVARGSGRAVAQLGAVARQAGVAVSLHGTGGAWIVASPTADPDAFGAAIYHSLDRKVCNTLNTCCIPAGVADRLVPVFLDALERAGARLGTSPKLHVVEGREHFVPSDWFERRVHITRAGGPVEEFAAEPIEPERIGEEWEWEQSPEVTLVVVDSVEEAVALYNRYSPRFVVSLIAAEAAEHDRFFAAVDAPFVGNGFTRWVDGQYALNRPELGLSNWQHGRLFARGGVLSGDSTYTIRTRVTQTDPDFGR